MRRCFDYWSIKALIVTTMPYSVLSRNLTRLNMDLFVWALLAGADGLFSMAHLSVIGADEDSNLTAVTDEIDQYVLARRRLPHSIVCHSVVRVGGYYRFAPTKVYSFDTKVRY